MNNSTHERLKRDASKSEVIAKLDRASRELVGGHLMVLLRCGDELVEIYPSGDSAGLPEFCRVLRTTPEGRQRCLTCRSLVAFGACYLGTIEYTCHGGITVFAASVRVDGESRAVVISCPLSEADLRKGWWLARDQVGGIGVDLRRLRAAYRRLPRRAEERLRIARILVDIAASAIGELASQASDPKQTPQMETADRELVGDDLQLMLQSALFVANDALPGPDSSSSDGRKLVELVIDMISRNPGMLFTASKVARAINMTPNHFSTLFHRHAGQKFSEFLLEQRIELTKKLLRDLSLNISQVAQLAGFRDSSYFARRFKKVTGLTPREWRSSL